MDTSSPNMDPHDFDQIEQYVLGQLSDEARIQFEAKMEHDPVFKEEVLLQQALIEGIEEKALQKKMDHFHTIFEENETSSDKKVVRLPRQQWYAIAASLMLLIGVGSIWFINRSPQNEQLFEKYFTPDPGLPTVMGATNNLDFVEAMTSYKRGNYDEAITVWEAQLQRKSNDTLSYFIGVAYLAKEEAKPAISYLNTIANSEDSGFYLDANYYLGLAYVKSNNIETAKSYLKKSTLAEAQALLNDLENE